MNLLFSSDPVTTSWLVALGLLFVVAVVVPILRLLLSCTIYAYAAVTGRHQLRATAARIMPRLGHLLGSLVVGVASVAAPAIAAPQTDAVAVSVDRDGGFQQPTPGVDPSPQVSEPESTQSSTLYVVKTGDTLWDIAAARLDNPTDAQISETWKAIWRANRRVVGDHPEFIRPGMELVVEGVTA